MADTHVIVLPGGGYATHARNEAEPIVEWLSGLGVASSVFRYPLNVGLLRRREETSLPLCCLDQMARASSVKITVS